MKKSINYLSIVFMSLCVASTISCNEGQIGAIEQDQVNEVSNENVLVTSFQKSDARDHREVYDAFIAMVKKVQSMEREELERLTEAEILELGQPILDATEGTTTQATTTLEKLNTVLQPMAENIRTVSREEHKTISDRVKRILEAEQTRTQRVFDSEEIRNILLNINGGTTTMSSTCEDLFDQWGGYVHLYPGDNMNLANSICPAGSMFWVHGGTYYNQNISDSKDGNYWLGVNGVPVIDGQYSITKAFNSGMKNNIIAYLVIQNYTDHGIYSESTSTTDVEINYMEFNNIAPSKDGESNAAVTFENCEDIEVRNSSFEDVVSGILFTSCDGPLKAQDNEALNPGRNFFQCDKCEGGGIRVNGNSLEHTTGYGNAVLEDWINIYDSKGISTDYIKVNNNRARIILNNGNASGVSDSGCFILLGDKDGSYQEASNNIGVNPGNCGVGLAGGTHMLVSHNKMYSQEISGISNVAFYSRNFSTESPKPPCEYHHYISQSNSSDWICGNSEHCNPPTINKAHANDSCTDENGIGITNSLINSFIKQETLGPGITGKL